MTIFKKMALSKKKTNPMISVNPEITVSFSKNVKSKIFLVEAFCVLISLYGCILSLTETIFDVVNPLIVFCGIAFPIGFIMLFRMKKHKIVAISGAFALFLIILSFLREQLQGGLLLINANIVNGINKVFNRNFGFATRQFTYDEFHFSTNLLMISIIFVLSFLIALMVIKVKTPILLALIFAPFIYCNITFSTKIAYLPLLLHLLAFVGTYVIACTTEKPFGKKVSKLFVKCGKTVSLSHEPFLQSGATKSVASVMLLTVIIVSIVTATVPDLNFKQNHKNTLLDKSIKGISNFTDNIAQNKIYIPWLSELIVSNKGNSGIGAGDLSGNKKITYANVPHLEIITDDTIQPTFLKAYVGSVYTNNKWEELPEQAYEKFTKEINWAGVNYDQFSETYNSSLKEIFTVNSEIEKTNKEIPQKYLPMNKYNMNIKNVGANKKYHYLPYFYNTPFGNTNPRFDSYIASGNLAQDQYDVSGYSFDDEMPLKYSSLLYIEKVLFVDDNGNKFLINQIQNEYPSFVKENYTQLPNENAEFYQKLSNEIMLGANLKNDNSKKDNKLQVQAVIDYLHKNTEYSLAPPKVPKGKDAIEDFLTNGKKGYCVHYATAATMLLRANGIPCRYAEGYNITTDDIYDGKMVGKNKKQLTIKDTNAHAWVEIFDKYIGWYPVEVTPGYTSINSSSQTSQNISSEASSAVSSEPVSSNLSSEQASSNSSNSSESSMIIESSNPNSTGTSNAKTIKLILLFSTIVLTIILLISSVFVRRSIILKRRKSSFKQSDKNKAEIAMFIYITKIIAELNIFKKDFINLEEYANSVSTKTPVGGTDIIKVCEITNRARYSNHMISQEELDFVENYSIDLLEKTLERLKPFRKFKAKFFKCL